MLANVKQELIDEMAGLEVGALLEGLKDEDLRRNPAFLEKVRKFLKENNFKTTPETEGVAEIEKKVVDIPVFEVIEGCK